MCFSSSNIGKKAQKKGLIKPPFLFMIFQSVD